MRVLWALLLATAFASAARPPRSACTKQTQGRLWPDEANADRTVARDLMRSGEVFICSYGLLHYRWEPLSVNFKILKTRAPRPQAEATEPKTEQKAPSTRDTP